MRKLKLILTVCASIIMLSDTVYAKPFNKADVSDFWNGGRFGGLKNELDKIKEFLYRTTDAYAVKQKLSQNDRVTLTDYDKTQLVEMILSILMVNPEFSNTRDPNFKLRATGPTDEELDLFIRSLFRADILNHSETFNVLSDGFNEYLQNENVYIQGDISNDSLKNQKKIDFHRKILFFLYVYSVYSHSGSIQMQDSNAYEIKFISQDFVKNMVDQITEYRGEISQSERDHIINLIKRWNAYVKVGGGAQYSDR